MKWSLPVLAMRRPVTVIMVVVTALGLGVIAWYRIPLEFIPKLDVPFIGCFIPYPGATPEQVENEIAIPAEGEFRTVSNLKKITTSSDSNGCMVRLNFDWDVDMAMATAEVRDRMERLKLKLPAEVDRLMLRRFSSNSLPIMAFTIFRAGDDEELAYRARTILQPRLMRIDGVAEVTVFGKPEREVVIEFDQNALRAHELSLYQVVGQLQSSSLNVSLGELVEGRTKYYVRVMGEFTLPEQMAELVIGHNALRLKDVAKVGYRTREVDEAYRIDQKGGVFMLVVKESEANTMKTCRAVAEELERIKEDPAFEGLDVFMFMDQSKMIGSALDGLVGAGQFGAVLSTIVLFLFLRRLLPTVVVALSIPSSLVVAFVYMFFTGMTLNIVTMASMIIAVGMLVDNSIVVMENIYRYRQLGVPVVESARRGATEVGMAITASTLTTVVVFIPIFYIESGEMAIYMRQFAGPVTASLLASLALALTVIPLAVGHMGQSRLLTRLRGNARIRSRLAPIASSAPGRWLGFVRRIHLFKAILRVYQATLSWTIHRRPAAILLIAALCTLTILVPFKRVGIQKMPTVDTREVNIEVKLDQNYDMEMAEELFRKIQTVLDSQRDVLGIKNVFINYRATGGSVRAYLLQPEDLPEGGTFPYSTEQVLDILWKQLPERLPGAELRFSVAEAGEGQTRGIALMMRGDDRGMLDNYAEQFKRFLSTVPNLSDVETDAERARDEMQVRIDEGLADEAGVSPMVVARSVDFALRGIRLPYMKQGGREVPVWAQFREEDRKTRANLENVTVMGQTGELIPLNRLVRLERAKSPQAIQRVNGKNVVTINAKVTGADMAQVRREIDARIAAFEMAPGYTIDLGDELMELGTNTANFITSLLLSIILIYIVMGSLFESYVLPLSILTCVPLAFIGVYWGMFITGTSMDTVAFIGCILMVGVVVNNGIVIVDHINRIRREGAGRSEAILRGGRDRLRPVMMTALTTILGCVPLALGGGVGSQVSFNSLGRALIGGMTTGTFLTLVVVPLFYTLIDDLRHWTLAYLADLKSLAVTRARQRSG